MEWNERNYRVSNRKRERKGEVSVVFLLSAFAPRTTQKGNSETLENWSLFKSKSSAFNPFEQYKVLKTRGVVIVWNKLISRKKTPQIWKVVWILIFRLFIQKFDSFKSVALFIKQFKLSPIFLVVNLAKFNYKNTFACYGESNKQYKAE